MNKKIYIFSFLLFLFSCESEITRDSGDILLNKNFQALYVATVYNLDWPSSRNLNEVQQIKEMQRILNTAKELKINNIFLQVRPSGDVIYKSKYEPSSFFLTGKQGKTLTYDPLKRWIIEAKKRRIKIHAWINPFRLGVKVIKKYDKRSPRFKSFALELKRGIYWANPGDKSTTNYIIKLIKELIDNYDIAGIHFDDYF